MSKPRVLRSVARAFLHATCLALCVGAVPVAPAADEIGDAIDASVAAQRAARESQQRIDRLAAETRALREKRRAAEWQALQQAAYADQLEQEAAEQERRQAAAQAELERVATTGADLLPLSRRMLAALEAVIARDLPFLQKARQERVAGLKALLDDPQRGSADKYRRVLDAWRSEFEYGYSVGAEDVESGCGELPGPATQVRIGRIGLYCLAPDGRAARWNASLKRWAPLDDDAAAEVARAVAMARGKAPPELLVLPVGRLERSP